MENKEKYKCACCGKFITENEGITTLEGLWVCDNNSCRILNNDNDSNINGLSWEECNCISLDGNDWLFEENQNGYGIFTTDKNDDIPNAEHIQRIDELGMFDGDLDAAIQAEKDGMDIIFYQNIGYIKSEATIKKIILALQKML